VPAAKLTSKGQITIPLEVRKHLHLEEGERVEFVIGQTGEVTLRRLSGSVRQLRGLLKREGEAPVSLSEMDETIAEHHAREDERLAESE
jgi:AbrB family looped-hinge helix DNA binding protein